MPDIIERTRSVLPVIENAIPRIEQDGELPEDVVRAMTEAGLWRMVLPKSVGGAELPLPALSDVTELVATADASAAWCLGQATGCAMSAAYLAPEAASRVFGERDAVLAWGAGEMGTAIATDGGYRVSGTWRFASGGKHATWIGGHCKVFESDGRPRTDDSGVHANRTALFRRETAQFHGDWQVIGLKGTGSESYSVTDMFVETALTLDRENPEERGEDGPLYALPVIQIYAVCFGGVALGIARRFVDDLIGLANTKSQRAVAGTLGESPVFHSRIAQIEARLGAARAFQKAVTRDAWTTLCETGELSPEDNVRLRLATSHAIHEATDVVHHAWRLAGSTAVFEDQAFERRFRDMHAASQQLQGRFNHYETVGRFVMGGEGSGSLR